MTTTTKPLSPTQARIMELAARGLRDKEIADTLNMSFSAVRRH
ncbi:MAG: DNA-binding response regulator, partial [Verrucomicrobia bacterium]|nr:DNA-binding response regulator [Verrucomicrobiota bacterium]NDD40496.1 DNA-binding response regulator [Verrucomicrobiota bacterium]